MIRFESIIKTHNLTMKNKEKCMEMINLKLSLKNHTFKHLIP